MTDKPTTPARPSRDGNTKPSSATELAEVKNSRSRVGWFDAANVDGFHPTGDELGRGWIEWLSVRRAVILQSPDDTNRQNNLRRLLNADCEGGACVCREVKKRAGGTLMLCTDEDGQGFTHQTPARTETEYLVEAAVFLSWLFMQGLSPSKHVTAWGTAVTNPAPTRKTPAPVAVVSDGPATMPAVPNWKMLIQAEATAHCLRLRKAGANPTKHSILEAMAKWCRENKVLTDGNIYPSEGYLRTHVLGGKHWDVPN